MKAFRLHDNFSVKQKLLDVESKLRQTQEGMKDYTRMLLESMEDLKKLENVSFNEKENMQKEFEIKKSNINNFKISRSQSRESK